MLSKSQISLITSLQHKKFRRQHNLFIVEGLKSVLEFCHSGYQTQTVYHTLGFGSKMLKLSKNINILEISVADMARISSLKTPPGVLALITIPTPLSLNSALLKNKFSLVLDGVQDPGNMGTIIRTADWFGIKNVICSEDTVDVYNPKVVQATMGSLSRVAVHYADLETVISNAQLPVFGALLNGKSIYETNFGSEAIVVMGNEGNGISEKLQQIIQQPITIPQVGEAESLNVAVATAIFCSELYRNSLK
ncbi:TrmH family RNA methyltransferase [Mucilaginibacter ginkgonis]|uniref:RNA methyltransferase n=1 Tax=Mucilaginibacter ginkgonis TaxID=2682091 RepID=A0A6I4I773_9SPHI|nr:RNA methyltransferase [Mucilaginibacter ginkgonis]QQL50728.1 RNA methyltransferase [Mucilaginibacter ginkgonis]